MPLRDAGQAGARPQAPEIPAALEAGCGLGRELGFDMNGNGCSGTSFAAGAAPAKTAPVRPYVLGPDEGQAWWFLGNLVTVKAAGAQTRGRLTAVEFLNPPRFAPPLHRHLQEDEFFYVVSGTAIFPCGGKDFSAGPGDFVMLPVGLPHTFLVGPDEPLHVLQLTTPAGFEDYVAAVGQPAAERRLPDPALIDPAVLGHAAARYPVEILGPPPAPPG